MDNKEEEDENKKSSMNKSKRKEIGLSCMLNTEVGALLAVIRRAPESSPGFYHENYDASILQSLKSLRSLLFNPQQEWRTIDPSVYVSPFLDVIQSDDIPAAATAVALQSILKILRLGIFDEKTPGAKDVINSAVTAITGCHHIFEIADIEVKDWENSESDTEDNNMDSGYGISSSVDIFHFLCSLLNVIDIMETDGLTFQIAGRKYTSFCVVLDQFRYRIERGQHRQTPKLMRMVQGDLFHHLIHYGASSSPLVLSMICSTVLNIYHFLRKSIRLQLEAFFSFVLFRVASPGNPLQLQEVAMEGIINFCRQPTFIIEVYVNYDCDPTFKNVFEETGKLLCKYAFPTGGHLTSIQIQAFEEFTDTFEFTGMVLDIALRTYLETFRLPGESQKIQRILEAFSEKFYDQQSSDMFSSKDSVMTLCYSIIMLNTDQHNPQVKKKMTEEDFIRNNRSINGGSDLPREYLSELFHSISTNAISLSDQTNTVVEMNPNRWIQLRHVCCHRGPSVATVAAVLNTLMKRKSCECIEALFSIARIAQYGLEDILDELLCSFCKFTTLLNPYASAEETLYAFSHDMKPKMAILAVFHPGKGQKFSTPVEEEETVGFCWELISSIAIANAHRFSTFWPYYHDYLLEVAQFPLFSPIPFSDKAIVSLMKMCLKLLASDQMEGSEELIFKSINLMWRMEKEILETYTIGVDVSPALLSVTGRHPETYDHGVEALIKLMSDGTHITRANYSYCIDCAFAFVALRNSRIEKNIKIMDLLAESACLLVEWYKAGYSDPGSFASVASNASGSSVEESARIYNPISLFQKLGESLKKTSLARREEVRNHAVMSLQRSFTLAEDLLFTPTNCINSFYNVIFAMVDDLHEKMMQYSRRENAERETRSMEGTVMLSMEVLTDVYLHFLKPISESPNFRTFWLGILRRMDTCMKADLGEYGESKMPDVIRFVEKDRDEYEGKGDFDTDRRG
ncbi:hypothetical protein DH2020_042453 [Rehmannia glutinosa]|uniref:SEC7 domain-containing protein n=1 Tax=Rehmannia glutinosa TaxID=99300 RepID=A0ABR0UMC4_REHGL